MQYLLPTIQEGSLYDGEFIKCLPFCKKNACSKKCQQYYIDLVANENMGFYTCPHGLSTYLFKNQRDTIVFTGFREKVTYNKNKANAIKAATNIYNPLLEQKQVEDLLKSQIQLHIQKEEFNIESSIVKNIVHEVKKLNVQIKEHCEYIWNEYPGEHYSDLSEKDLEELFDRYKTITVCSNMVFSRFSIYDYINNPSSFKMGARFSCNVYKKFDKINKILRNYQKKNVKIRFIDSSFYEFRAYTSFEIIPLLLLENAVKYSRPNREVQVIFNHSNKSLVVQIISDGPYCDDHEIGNVFDKGFRGTNATRAADGNGLGLYFVKEICDLHEVKIHIESKKITNTIDENPAYGIFKVTLIFPET